MSNNEKVVNINDAKSFDIQMSMPVGYDLMPNTQAQIGESDLTKNIQAVLQKKFNNDHLQVRVMNSTLIDIDEGLPVSKNVYLLLDDSTMQVIMNEGHYEGFNFAFDDEDGSNMENLDMNPFEVMQTFIVEKVKISKILEDKDKQAYLDEFNRPIEELIANGTMVKVQPED